MALQASGGSKREASPAPDEVFVKLCWDRPHSLEASMHSAAHRHTGESGQTEGTSARSSKRISKELELRQRVQELEEVLAAKDAEIALKTTELEVASRLIERRQLRVEALKEELEEVRKDAHAELTRKSLLIESLQADLEELQTSLDGQAQNVPGGKFCFELKDSQLSDSDSADGSWPPASGAKVKSSEIEWHALLASLIRFQPCVQPLKY